MGDALGGELSDERAGPRLGEGWGATAVAIGDNDA